MFNISKLQAQARLQIRNENGHMTPEERQALKKQGKTDKEIQAILTKRTEFNKKLRKSSDGFEALFLQKILGDMRKNTAQPTILDGGRGEKIFKDMLDQKYAERMSKTRSFGLGNFIFEQYKK